MLKFGSVLKVFKHEKVILKVVIRMLFLFRKETVTHEMVRIALVEGQFDHISSL